MRTTTRRPNWSSRTADRRRLAAVACLLIVSAVTHRAPALGGSVVDPEARAVLADDRYAEDVEFLLDSIEQNARELLKEKGVDWKAVRKQFTKEVKKVRDDVAHVRLCERLMAATRDGHAGITDVHFEFPSDERSPEQKGVGLSLGFAGKKVVVKDCYGPAFAAGVRSGFEVVKIDDKSPQKWLQDRAAWMSEREGFSTDCGALFAASHRGLADVPGTSWSFKFKNGRDTKSLTLTCAKGGGNGFASGPVFPPSGAKELDRQSYAVIEDGIGWIHLRTVPDGLPSALDEMLGDMPGLQALVLDMRANGGGGADHDAVFSRFLKEGENLAGRQGQTEGEHYAGPMVVIVDGGCASAGETVSGMLKESGRAYLIGPEGTAGMSGSKETATVPSGLFTVRYVVQSYRAGGGSGPAIEGHGIQPHEVVEYDPKILIEGKDPMIERAVELLKEGLPRETVKYP